MDEVRGVIGQEATPPSADNILIMSQMFFLILSNIRQFRMRMEKVGEDRGRVVGSKSAFMERAAPRGNLCTS